MKDCIKQVIVFRTDLKLGKGKLATHAGHAAVMGYELVKEKDLRVIKEWINGGQKKVVLKVSDERELLSLFNKVKRKIPSQIIRDAGLTQIEPGTITCIVIGPWYEKEIDDYTKDLKLL